MEQRSERNYDLRDPDIFTVVNHYFLLFFSLSCVLCSVFLQEIFILLKQFRLGISFAPIIGILLPTFLLTRKFPSGFRKQLRIQSPRLLFCGYVILSTLLVVVIVDHIYLVTQRFMPAPEQFIEGLKELKPHGFWSVVATFIGICVIVPVAEEIVFRGIVQQVFSRNMNGILAFLLAAVVFGVIHLTPHLLISVTVFGVFLGFLFFASSNLFYTMLSHGVFNAVAFLQLTLSPKEVLQEPPFYIGDVWILITSIVLLGFLINKMRKGDSADTKSPFDMENRSGTN